MKGLGHVEFLARLACCPVKLLNDVDGSAKLQDLRTAQFMWRRGDALVGLILDLLNSIVKRYYCIYTILNGCTKGSKHNDTKRI